MTKNPAFVLFLFVFIITTFISLEVGKVYKLKNTVDIDMQRAVNAATMLAVDDDYRIDKIAYIDTTKTKEEFNKYLIECLELNAGKEKYVGGKLQYKIVIDSMTEVSTPPSFEVRGSLCTTSTFLSKFTNRAIVIPFYVKARTVRID